jgi:hypothetical protein
MTERFMCLLISIAFDLDAASQWRLAAMTRMVPTLEAIS